MGVQRLVIKKKFSAPREKLFAAWSQPDIMKHWLKPNAQWSALSKNTLAVGGKFHHTMVTSDGKSYMHEGEYKEVNPNRKLIFTWNSDYAKDTLVTVEFEDRDGQTELTLSHDLFTDEETRKDHFEGWTQCLENLDSTLKNS
ncbi:MAG: SRPBCC domain-containing protein [Alphaproteobacteria bacterium]|nr:SRPBCC domain-containing protein [Alphaproteobacteria bacterium]